MKIIITVRFLIYLLISYLGLIVILNLNFLEHYANDIFDKGFSVNYISLLIYHTSIKNSIISLQFGILMASIFSAKHFAKKNDLRFKSALITNLPVVILIAALYFAFVNWQVPKSSLEVQSILYEMKSTAPEGKIDTLDRKVFSNDYRMVPINRLDEIKDTLNMQIDEQLQKCDSLLRELPDSIAKRIYIELDLLKHNIPLPIKNNSKELTEHEVKRIEATLNSLEHGLMLKVKYKDKFVQEKRERLIQPIKLILIFMIGIAFGYLYSDQKSFLLFILGTTTLGVFYVGEYSGIEHLIIDLIIDEQNDVLASIILLGAITSIFIILGLKKSD